MISRGFCIGTILWQLAMAICAIDAHAEKRVALVIGNTAYQNTPALSNPINDAEDLAAALKQVGFTVVLERNLSKRGMEAAIARFARLAQNADAAMFFYAGHGMQWRGLNYLVPVDAKLEDEFNVNFELTRLDDVLFGLERARGVKILVLDACRNNPLLDKLNRVSTTRDLVAIRGLAKIEPSRGMVIAYSTQINQIAIDGHGRNSPFTGSLVKEIKEPGVEIGTLFRRVAEEVNRTTEGRQLPELSLSLVGKFYFNNQDTDIVAWSKIRNSNDPIHLRKFISDYPKSMLVPDARQRLAAIEREQIEREQKEREEKAREQIARENVQREEAAKEKAAKTQTAILTPPSGPPTNLPLSGNALIQEIKKELKRVGCYTGPVDDEWAADTKASVQKFAKLANLKDSAAELGMNLLDTLRSKSGRVCPANSSPGTGIASGARVFKQEPRTGVGAIGFGEVAYVDDGTCAKGLILQIIGGSKQKGIGRKRKCVPR